MLETDYNLKKKCFSPLLLYNPLLWSEVPSECFATIDSKVFFILLANSDSGKCKIKTLLDINS